MKQEYYKDEFLKMFKQLAIRTSPWKVWDDFITMFACAISNSSDKDNFYEREVIYKQIIQNTKYSREELELFSKLTASLVMALEINPEQDFLGDIFMNLNLGNYIIGQFFTPYGVCELMSGLTGGDIASHVKKDGYMKVHDPCCGAGATLIAMLHQAKMELQEIDLNFQNHILFVGQDIDRVTALMCYIQISLLGVAGYVKVGDSLTEPMKNDDALEDYWFTPMYFSDTWSMRRLFHGKQWL